jgi:hypothetical protein
VALHIAGTDQYTVWNTDSSGNFVSNGTGGVIVSGQSSVFKSFESIFHQDLNNDGLISVSAGGPSGFASHDSFLFAADMNPTHTVVLSSGSVENPEAILTTGLRSLVSNDPGAHSSHVDATSDALAYHHLDHWLLGHVIIQ